jgi:microcystin-dependent protein
VGTTSRPPSHSFQRPRRCTDFAGLFPALSTAHGTGDCSTTFNLPDLRGRVVAGKDNMGGSSAARLNLLAGGSTTLGAAYATFTSMPVATMRFDGSPELFNVTVPAPSSLASLALPSKPAKPSLPQPLMCSAPLLRYSA